MTDRLKDKSRWSPPRGRASAAPSPKPSSPKAPTSSRPTSRRDKLKGLKAAKRAKLDVRSTEAVEAFAKAVDKEFGALDMLVNCRRLCAPGHACSTAREKDWDFSFDLNVKSMHRTIKAFLPAMLKKGGGSIVNMSSGVSSIRGVPEPLRLRRHQGGGDRADQGGRRRLHHARASAATRSAPAPSSRRRSTSASTGGRQGRPASRSSRCARISSTASRWAGSAPPRKSPRSPCSWPPTNRATSPASRISSMAAWRFDRPPHRRVPSKVGLDFRRAKAR